MEKPKQNKLKNLIKIKDTKEISSFGNYRLIVAKEINNSFLLNLYLEFSMGKTPADLGFSFLLSFFFPPFLPLAQGPLPQCGLDIAATHLRCKFLRLRPSCVSLSPDIPTPLVHSVPRQLVPIKIISCNDDPKHTSHRN